MIRRGRFLLTASTALAGASFVPAAAQMMNASEASPHAEPKEREFIVDATRYLHGAYAKPEAAERAGFVRFTNEDKTGAISYANLHWTSTDAQHPSQVWYDMKGQLLGADYSVLQTDSPNRPNLWNIDPRRWITLRAHMHYGIREADGTIKYGGLSTKKFEDAGGTISDPKKEVLVSMGLAKSPSDVAFVFLFPAIWDLQLWVIPNPDGEFAEYNPKIKPQNAQKHPMDM